MYLDIIIGPMFSGKSFELIRRIRLLKVLKKNFLVIKPIIDRRYTKDDYICTHNYDKEKCISVEKLNDIFEKHNLLEEKIETIFIDEAQFFENLKDFVMEILEKFNINIVIAGLDGDYKRNNFGEIHKLIPLCDNITKKKSLCLKCNNGNKALFSHRICSNNSQILVGSENKYIPVCRKHYLELN